MKKLSILILLATLLAIAVTPVGAMIGGELDYEHTNVGAIVIEWPAYDDILARVCTATLIHPKVLVTAAHCTEPLYDLTSVPDKVWITFEPDALFGTPDVNPDEYLEVAELISHPQYGTGKEYDIALVILVEPVGDRDPVALPESGYMDGVLQNLPGGKGKSDLELIFVGYGATDDWGIPGRYLDAERRVGTLSFVNLMPLEILTNNKPDDPVVCTGDSGGPVFHVPPIGNEVLVGLHARSGSPNVQCDGLGLEVKTRLEAASIQTWINDNLPE